MYLYAAKLGQVEYGAYVHVVASGLQCIAEELVGRLRVVLRRRASQSQKIRTARRCSDEIDSIGIFDL